MAARYPKHELAARAALKAGDALIAAKQTPAAMTAYRLVVDHYPASPEADSARKALGGVLDSVTDPVQLAAALKNASPAERTRGQLRIARIYLEAKNYSEAIADLTEMLKVKPDAASEAEAQYLLGISNESLNHIAPAASAYAEAVRLNGSAEWVMDAEGRLAWLYLDLKQPANAEKAAAAAIALHPEKSAETQARLALVQAQVDQQKWDAALDGCKSLLDSNPNGDTIPTVLYTQAWIDEQRNHSDEALPIWQRLANEYPKSPNTAEALIHLGDAQLKAEKYDEARTFYSRLITDFPKSTLVPQAHFKLGSSLFNSDKPADAASEFILAADDKTAGDYIPEALYWAGVALDKSGKKDEAIQRLTKLVTVYPKHARTPNAKIRLAALKAVSGS
jgi:TolA-binding protein